jgi:hypothetical protein
MPPVNAHAVLGEPFLEDVAANWTSRKLRVTVFPATANLAKPDMHQHAFTRQIPLRYVRHVSTRRCTCIAVTGTVPVA